jgi:hypothetical protein
MFLTMEDGNTLYVKMKIIIGPVLRNWIIVIISIETTIGIKGFRIFPNCDDRERLVRPRASSRASDF